MLLLRQIIGWLVGMPVTAYCLLPTAYFLTGCANTATSPNQFNTLVLELRVKGSFQLGNPSVLYYVVLDTSGDASLGPRVFGPDPNIRPPRLEASLPFSASNLPGITQAQSTWTDYFVMGGGTTVMQRGQLGTDGIVRIVDPQYSPSKWRFLDNGQTLELQILLSDLRSGTRIPGLVTLNFASADQRGFYYDRWAINSEFILVASAAGAPELRDQNFQPPYGLTTNELQAIKQLPGAVRSDDVDFSFFRVRTIS